MSITLVNLFWLVGPYKVLEHSVRWVCCGADIRSARRVW
jgi:hypothetical protein